MNLEMQLFDWNERTVAFIDSLVLVLLYYFTMYNERHKIP